MNISLYMQEVQNWIKEIQSDRGRDPKHLMENCDKLEEYGRKIHDDALIGFACFSRGETYYLMNDTRNFYAEMLACLPAMEKIGEWGYVVMANNMLGIMSMNRGNAPYAMDYYLKALSYCEKYGLPQLEWIVHMNMGCLYQNIHEYQKALDHLESGYHYIIVNQMMPGYIQHLTAAYLNMAKAYLCMAKEQNATEMLTTVAHYNDKIEKECKPYLQNVESLAVSCFQARYYYEKGQEEALSKEIMHISDYLKQDVPIMDVYDDLYEYMCMLLEGKRYDDFKSCYFAIEELTKQTNIRNLEKRLLTILICYYKSMEDEEHYQKATVAYYELSEEMEKENSVMVASMIQMRNSLNNLVQINWEVEQENIALHQKSETDPLTGLYNRYKLNEYGEDAFMRACDKQTPLAIEILDIDYFKEYNDNYGHQAGDEVLKMISRILLQMQKHENVFCSRYGGDEFVLIYSDMPEEETYQWSEQLKQMIMQQAIEHKHSKSADIITISQGICWGIPTKENKVWDFLHAADVLLYEVKKVSRNSIRLGYLNGAEELKTHE